MIAEKTVREKVECYHCGEDCDDGIIEFESKSFCCTGCKLVYQLLEENGLTSYYAIEQTPGVKQRDNQEYDFLKNQAIADQVLQFQSERMNRITLSIPAIHCSACIFLLEQLHKINPAVIRSEVNFIKREASIDFDPKQISLSELAYLLQTMGYPPKINLERKGQDKQDLENRNLALKIAVAGFCFGNVMLLSFPDYLGLDLLTDADYRDFFSYLNMALALPVLFYSGIGYLDSAVRSLIQKYMNLDVPIALGMITLVARSYYEIISGAGGGYLDSFTGLIFFLLLGKWFQNRTYQFLSFERDYKSYFPLGVSLLKNGEVTSIPLDELRVGDHIRVRNQEVIPADSLLLKDRAQIDYSFVTGESETVNKSKGEQLYAGGRLVGSSVEMEVIKEVSQSYLTRLWNHDDFKKEDKFKSLADRISQHFTLAILSIAIVSATYWQFVNPNETWEVFTAVLIVACPCALALASPFTLGNSLRILGKNHLYLKSARVIEKMAELSTIVFDKTGTVTLPNSKEIKMRGDLEGSDLGKLAALTAQSAHPLSQKINQFLNIENHPPVADYQEYPGKGISGKICGEPVRLGSGKYVMESTVQLSNDNRVYFSIGNDKQGYFETITSYRLGLSKLLNQLKHRFKIHILTGDHSQKEKERFENDFGNDLTLTFNQGPSDKLNYLKTLQNLEERVMMVGDGLNDAGALKKSDVGIAITDDTGLFTPASDGILKGDMITRLPDFLKLSRGSRKVVIASFILSFIYNIAGLSFAVSGSLTPLTAAILMPLSSITVVTFSTVMVNILGRRLNLI